MLPLGLLPRAKLDALEDFDEVDQLGGDGGGFVLRGVLEGEFVHLDEGVCGVLRHEQSEPYKVYECVSIL